MCEALSNATQPYDVIFFPDGDLRKDALDPGDLGQYRPVILPDCAFLTEAQVCLLHDILAAGTRLLAPGVLGTNLAPDVIGPVLDHPGTRREPSTSATVVDDLLDEPQVRVTPNCDLMINVLRVEGGAAVYLIRYGFDVEQDRAQPLPELTIELRLPEQFDKLSVHSPSNGMTGALEREGFGHRLRFRDVPLYSVALLEPA